MKKSVPRRKRMWILPVLAIVVTGLALVLIFWNRGGEAQPAGQTPLPTATAAPNAPSAPNASSAPTVASPIPTAAVRTSPLTRSLYKARLDLDWESRVLVGTLELHYLNTSPDTLYAIRLHLYPNTASPGCMTIQRVALNSYVNYYTITGEAGDILNVPLINELRTGEACLLLIQFTVAIPKSEDFGFADKKTALLPCAFPIAAYYENGWVLDATSTDLNYAPISDFRIILNTPEGISLSCSGKQIEDSAKDSVWTPYYVSKAASQFEITASKSS